MKKLNKTLLLSLLIAVLVGATYVYAAGTTMVNLGAADDFAVLAGSTITNTGSSVINGDLGLSPGTSLTGFPPGTVNGTQHVADAQASLAQTDLTNAYNDAAGRTPVSTVPTELGGTTLTPGVYDSADGTFDITGTLTLDAEGDSAAVFIFKTASTLTTAGASNVVLTGDAQACNVFWQVGSSATLGTNSNLKGNILALTSITLTTGSDVDGRVLARNGAVTLDSNIITKPSCDTSTGTSTPELEPRPESEPESELEPEPTPTSTPTSTTTTAPMLPNTGIGPDGNSVPWNIIAPIAIIASLSLLYTTRRRKLN
ncbi:MAG: ice-binding family protein [Candidatus Paceibacterota bacterium]